MANTEVEQPIPPLTRSATEAAQILGISPRTVRRLAEHREIGHCRVGGQLRFSDLDMTEFVMKTRVPAAT
jgi:excisionase family DNA binding protein